MISKILIGLALTSCVLASEVDDFKSLSRSDRLDFISHKSQECQFRFDVTRRQILEDQFCKDMVRKSNEEGVTRGEIRHCVTNFNERLFDDLLAFCADNYKGKSYITHLIFTIGEIKIKDRLLDRLFHEGAY